MTERNAINLNRDVVTEEMVWERCPQRNGREAELSPMFWRKRVRVEHTGDGVTRRPTVLKTVAVTGLHALPRLTIHTLAASALGQACCLVI